MSVGAMIRERRDEMRLTQEQVAARVGISKPYLSNIETERAKNPPTDGILRGLEEVLGFPEGELTRVAHLARTPVDIRSEHEQLEAEVRELRTVLRGLIAGGKDGQRPPASAPGAAAAGVDLDAVLARIRDPGNVRPVGAGVLVPVINRVSAGYPHVFTDLDYPPSVADDYIRCPELHDPQAFAARVVGDSMEPDYGEGDIVVFSPNTPPRGGSDCFVRFEPGKGTTFKRFYRDDERSIRLQPLNSQYPAETYPREQITGLWPAVFRMQRIG